MVVLYVAVHLAALAWELLKRTRDLVQVNPKAVKLTMMGVHPAQSFGHQAV
jgi:hypothetical protein